MVKFTNLDEVSEKYGIKSNDSWLKLVDGDNRIRIISEFEDYGVHYLKDEKKSVICIGKDQCKLCKKNIEVRCQFLGWVIDRSDNQVKLFRTGYSVIKQISELAKSSEYGFEGIPPYDIIINKKGQGLETKYSVLPARQNTPLTESELQLITTLEDPKEIINNMKEKVESEYFKI